MKIWLISKFEQTPIDLAKSSRFQCIAEYAAARGNEVTFFTSTFKHNTKSQRYDKTTVEKVSYNYSIVFVKSLSYKDNISFKRLYQHYVFSKNILPELNKHSKPDIILMTFPPISLAYELGKWAKKNNIPYIIDIIDPWPDIFLPKLSFLPEFARNIILYPMRKKTGRAFSGATAVSAISNQFLEWSKKYSGGEKDTYCFYPARQLKDMQEAMAKYAQEFKKDPEKLRVIYAGSLASSYDIPTILQACEILYHKYGDKIEFVIAGAGPQKELIEKQLEKVNNLTYLGRIPKTELLKEYYLADIGLTQHIKGAFQTVTYKLFDLLSCGLPIMNSLESEMKDIILENNVGLFNKPGDAKKLAQNIESCYLNRKVLNEMKKNAINLTAKSGDALKVYNEVVDLLESKA